MKKCLFVACFLFPVLLFSQVDEGNARNWALKTDLLNPVFESVSMEVERRMGEKWTMGVQAGLTWGTPTYYDEFNGKLWGYYCKIGPKFYLQKEKAEELTGFSVQPQLMFSYWRDYDSNLWGNRGGAWENSVGLIVQGSYVLRLGKTFRIEPMLGIGYAATFFNGDFPNDTNVGPVTYKTRWFKAYWDEIEQPPRTHFSLPLDIAVSVGLNFGITF